jgi:anti-anti-sigma regulatory factor
VRSGTRLPEGASLSAVLSHIFHRRVEAPPVCLVALEGEHDLSTRPDLDDVLTEALAGGDPVIVDLRRATFADASILSAIITAKNAAGRRGLAVVLPSEGEVRMPSSSVMCGRCS